MADEQVVTSADEPGQTVLTSDAEPQPSSDSDGTPPPQPTTDDMSARLSRLEANLKGTTEEWRRERAERERLQSEVVQLRQTIPQPQPQPQITHQEPAHKRYAGKMVKAVLNGDENEAAEFLREYGEEMTRSSQQQTAQLLAQVGMEGQVHQSWNDYLREIGVPTNTSDPTYQRIQNKVQNMVNSPKYAWARGDQRVLWSTAALEDSRQHAANTGAAMELARETATATAATERPKQTGLPPGKKPVVAETMYFKAEERKPILMLKNALGVSEAEAEKRYWAQLPGYEKEERQKRKKA